MKSKNLKFGILMFTGLSLGMVSCKKEGCTDPTAENYSEEAKKDDGSCTFADPVVPGVETVTLTGFITSNTTLTADKFYVLNGKVIVNSGVTLTIEPGTIIKGQEGTDVNASALIIARGATINAAGTAAKPIIFTSVLDNIAIGQLAGTNLMEGDAGKWGGLIVLGNAPVSATNGDTQGQIEGIPATDAYGAFGGSSATDNSGVLKYISIRHGGAIIGAGNDINGLTLGGVGSGTVVQNIEVVGNLDDGIEIFGGSVNVSNVLISFQQDDAIDVDMNWSGTLTNFYTINGTGTTSDKALEIDGPEGITNTTGLFGLTNGTCIVYGGGYATGDFKSKAQGTVTNVVFGTAKISANFDAANACANKSDAYSNLTGATQKLFFTDAKFTSTLVYTSVTTCTIPAEFQGLAEARMTSNASATGADKTVFNTWSWTSIKGKL